jgi:hypothetical protein
MERDLSRSLFSRAVSSHLDHGFPSLKSAPFFPTINL